MKNKTIFRSLQTFLSGSASRAHVRMPNPGTRAQQHLEFAQSERWDLNKKKWCDLGLGGHCDTTAKPTHCIDFSKLEGESGASGIVLHVLRCWNLLCLPGGPQSSGEITCTEERQNFPWPIPHRHQTETLNRCFFSSDTLFRPADGS